MVADIFLSELNTKGWHFCKRLAVYCVFILNSNLLGAGVINLTLPCMTLSEVVLVLIRPLYKLYRNEFY